MKKWIAATMAFVLFLGVFGWGGVPEVHAATPPVIVSTMPANGAQGVSINPSSIQFTFNEKVSMTNGYITVTNEKTGAQQRFAETSANGIGKIATTDNLTFQLEGLQPFEAGTRYVIKVDGKLFLGEDSKELSTPTEWAFSTKSQQEAASFSPQGQGITLPADAQITFNRPVQAGQGSIKINKFSDNSVVKTLAAKDFTVNGLTATTKLDGLEAGTAYYVTMDAGAFLDLDDGTPVAGFSGKTYWNFTTNPGVDTNPPKITKRSLDGTAVPPQTRLELTFDKSVYQVTGNIVIKSDGRQDIVLPVTSAITGGGSAIIQSTNVLSLEANRTYVVSIPKGAFRDAAGNLMEAAEWSFRTQSTDTTAPTIVSFDPSSGSVSVPSNKTLIVTFSKPIVYTGKGVELRRKSSSYSESASVNVRNSKELWIYPASNLQENTVYAVSIARGAVKDEAGNEFAGLSEWAFSTAITDRNPPTVEDVTMYNNSLIQIRYNKTLDSNVNPPANEFTVTVNNEGRRVSSAYTSSNFVYVSLESGVAVGQDVKISYAARFRMVRDTVGNAASSFSTRAVENKVDTTLTKLRDGYISGSTLYLYFTDSLKSVSSYADGQFTVTYNDSSVGIDKLSHNSGSSTVTLSLNRSVSNGDVVKVSYTPGNYPLEDTRGSKVGTIDEFFVRNSYDNKPPELKEATALGTKMILKYNKPMDKNNIPMKSHFSVLVNEKPRYVTKVEIKDNRVELTLQSAVLKTDTVTVSYVRGNPPLRDWNYNYASNLNLVSVSNSTDSEAPIVQSLTWKSPSIILTFNKRLESMSSTYYPQFLVTSGNQAMSIKQVSASGTQVTIELMYPPTDGSNLSVTYNTGSKALKSESGIEIKTFSNMKVNGTGTSTGGTTGSLDSYFVKSDKDSSFGDYAYVLLANTAQITSDRTNSGITVNRYTLDTNKVKTAFEFAGQSMDSDKQLRFEVPSSEAGARVVVPLAAFEKAYSRTDVIWFTVKYKDVVYGISLNRDTMSKIIQRTQGSITNSSLLFEIEPVNETVTITNELSSSQATAMVKAYQFSLFNLIGNGSGTVLDIDSAVKMKTAQSVTASRAALVEWIKSYSKFGYLPTKLSRAGLDTVATTNMSGSKIILFTMGKQSYADVQGHWAQSDVMALVSKMIMNSRSTTKFEPNKPITREEFAVSIARALGLTPDSEAAKRFRDVNQGDITGAYIGAAIRAGIISGFPDGTFKPKQFITREQITLMMVRAAQASGYRMSAAHTDVLKPYKDYKDFTRAGSTIVAQAVQDGLIQGVSANRFDPKGSATRAQAAILLNRLLKKVGYITLDY